MNSTKYEQCVFLPAWRSFLLHLETNVQLLFRKLVLYPFAFNSYGSFGAGGTLHATPQQQDVC